MKAWEGEAEEERMEPLGVEGRGFCNKRIARHHLNLTLATNANTTLLILMLLNSTTYKEN